MIFERFEDDTGLSQYSYVVGCSASREAAVVDPRRDTDVYHTFARANGLRIRHVLETHIHADFASGAVQLAADTGAEHRVSRFDAGEVFEARFPHRDLDDGEAIELGNIRIEARHTPGHTPEHISFLVYDTLRAQSVPELFLTGDFLFVGSVGRPDLLGDDAKLGLARQMYSSLRERIRDLPDGLEIHPGHGAGSMCGAGMSGRAMSTLGFERAANPFMTLDNTESAFAEHLLGTVPPFPDYYRRMKRLNADGAPAVIPPDDLPLVSVAEAGELIADGALVIDARHENEYGRAHIHGAFGIGARGASSRWAGWVVPYETPMLMVADDRTQMAKVARGLRRVGLDDIRGMLEGGMSAWIAAGLPVSATPQIAPAELQALLEAGDGPQVLDVREDSEFEIGHISHAVHIMGGELPERLDEVPNGARPVAIVCRSGYRSTVAASVLERAGFTQVMNVAGGMVAWRGAGLPTEAEDGS